ncbi:MAG: tRNA (N(6)-L-threonylcarbamoyladenosine(37)-C(2))-methylthiotransferase MtaB [Oscillospiraceae bacterium]|jgi:threonylcarbamoyladenosine tRNA methylthiotransferase MtaB|nr:tRNA (N(6)-L-threonylcarbamoyladenosine(37)-C(2))-methylthiotransferase MtaB [Oscillospiraceae bacterium]
MTVYFTTLGCKVNQADSDSLLRRMCAAGYALSPDPWHADVNVLNSCAVTAESERKTRQKLRHLRKENPNAILILTGCAVQTTQNTAKAYPEADILLGHADTQDILHHIEAFSRTKARIDSVSPHQRGEVMSDAPPALPQSRTRGVIKIEDGCDQFCSYCIIPFARGSVRSKPIETIEAEAAAMAAAGLREAVLVGIHLSAYGFDNGKNLADAVDTVSQFNALKRIRLGSLEPNHLPFDLLERLAQNDKLCPQFHISLQSGCNKTLHAMRRCYTAEDYAAIVGKLRTLFPHCAVTTDLMVGFPGETDADFTESLAFASRIGFAKMHVFPFSPRPHTPAAGMPMQIPNAVKAQRSQLSIQRAKAMTQSFLLSQMGTTQEVLTETPHPDGGMQGYTRNYTHVRVRDCSEGNALVTVKITVAKDGYCEAALCAEQ